MRIRLATSIAVGTLALAFAAQAIAAAPSQEVPGPDAVFTSGDPIVFRATTNNLVTPPEEMAFYISRDAQTNPSGLNTGVLTNWFDQVRGHPVGGGAYQGAPDGDDSWSRKPGTYFWQAAEPGCAPEPEPCESLPRALQILPLLAAAVTNPSQIETFLDRHPKHRTHKRRVKFRFSSNVEGARFRCLFASGWEDCDSPHVFRRLQPGRYKFKVRAIVNSELKDTTPAKWVFRVLRRGS